MAEYHLYAIPGEEILLDIMTDVQAFNHIIKPRRKYSNIVFGVDDPDNTLLPYLAPDLTPSNVPILMTTSNRSALNMIRHHLKMRADNLAQGGATPIYLEKLELEPQVVQGASKWLSDLVPLDEVEKELAFIRSSYFNQSTVNPNWNFELFYSKQLQHAEQLMREGRKEEFDRLHAAELKCHEELNKIQQESGSKAALDDHMAIHDSFGWYSSLSKWILQFGRDLLAQGRHSEFELLREKQRSFTEKLKRMCDRVDQDAGSHGMPNDANEKEDAEPGCGKSKKREERKD